MKFLLWFILLVMCWPLALAALVLYPLVWLLLLPFRIVGIAVGGVLELVWSVVTLPARPPAASAVGEKGTDAFSSQTLWAASSRRRETRGATQGFLLRYGVSDFGDRL
jgi:hypothetical protein